MLTLGKEGRRNGLSPLLPTIFFRDSSYVGTLHRTIVMTNDEQIFVGLGNVFARQRVAELCHKLHLALNFLLRFLG